MHRAKMALIPMTLPACVQATGRFTMNIEQARFNMIQQQVRPWNVLDDHMLALLEQVKREDFCPPEHRNLAFMDLEVPTGHGQVMLAPRVQARMVQDLHLKPTSKVMQIGAGTGFMTALLARSAASVMAYEINSELAKTAAINLQNAGIKNVDMRPTDGFKEVASTGPFDAIVLCGSVPSMPASLLEKLALGGRLMAITGDSPSMRLSITTREDTDKYTFVEPWDTEAPRLLNFPLPVNKFHF